MKFINGLKEVVVGVRGSHVRKLKTILIGYNPLPIKNNLKNHSEGDRVEITEECCRTISFALSFNLWIKVVKLIIFSAFVFGTLIGSYILAHNGNIVIKQYIIIGINIVSVAAILGNFMPKMGKIISVKKYMIIRRLMYGLYLTGLIGIILYVAGYFFTMETMYYPESTQKQYEVFALRLGISLYLMYVIVLKRLYYGLSLCRLVSKDEPSLELDKGEVL